MKKSPFPPCRLTVVALTVASLFAPVSLYAQQADSQRLKEVEVVGTSPLPGIGIEEDKLPYDVQSVNAETLYRSQTMNLTDFMSRNLSGVNINEVQGSPFQADITYRGFRLSGLLGSAQGLSVYLDGVRVNEPFGDVVNWDMIPEAAINNVTLIPGSNPVYGLNTLGGALAFTTKSGLTARMAGATAPAASSAMCSPRSDGSRATATGTCPCWREEAACWATACCRAPATAKMAPRRLRPACMRHTAAGSIPTLTVPGMSCRC